MMRKYRGLTVKTRRWAYGWYCQVEGKHFIILDDAELTFYAEDEIIGFVEVDPKTVGQYTGRKDENCKEVYDEDIVKVLITNLEDEGEFLCKVVWDQKQTKFKLLELPPYKYGEECGEIHCFEDMARIEIIGNIHENPEIVSGEK